MARSRNPGSIFATTGHTNLLLRVKIVVTLKPSVTFHREVCEHLPIPLLTRLKQFLARRKADRVEALRVRELNRWIASDVELRLASKLLGGLPIVSEDVLGIQGTWERSAYERDVSLIEVKKGGGDGTLEEVLVQLAREPSPEGYPFAWYLARAAGYSQPEDGFLNILVRFSLRGEEPKACHSTLIRIARLGLNDFKWIRYLRTELRDGGSMARKTRTRPRTK